MVFFCPWLLEIIYLVGTSGRRYHETDSALYISYAVLKESNDNAITWRLFPHYQPCALRWRHNERDSVSNHQPRDGLLSCLFRRRSKKTSKLRVTGLCVGNSPGTGEFPAQMASNAENVSIWWRHHGEKILRPTVDFRYKSQVMWNFNFFSLLSDWTSCWLQKHQVSGDLKCISSYVFDVLRRVDVYANYSILDV